MWPRRVRFNRDDWEYCFRAYFAGDDQVAFLSETDPATAKNSPRRKPMPFNPSLAVLYGRFIEAAYTMYENDQNNLTPPPSSNFPAGYTLTAWVQMKDFPFIGNPVTKFYGFIAHSARDPNLAIMAIRGTDNDLEWWDDINTLGMTLFRVPSCGNVGLGFERIYETMEVVEQPPAAIGGAPRPLKSVGGFAAQVAEHVKRHAAAYSAPGPAAIEVTGHSLGAALMTLYAVQNTKEHKTPVIDALYTLASPMVGDSIFVDVFNGLKLNSWRVINKQDIVKILPPFPPTYRHVDTEKAYPSTGNVVPSISCQHAVATYLSLIDPTLKPDLSCQLPSVA